MDKQTNPPEENKKAPSRRQRDLTTPLDMLTESQIQVLLSLARYRYLTVRQFVECGVAKNPGDIRNYILYRLCRRPQKNPVQFREYFARPVKGGRLSYLYALTEYGAQIVAEITKADVCNVRYPIGGIQHIHDYTHREAYIDFCIALDKWADKDLNRHIATLSHYFDKVGSPRKGEGLRSVNRIRLPNEMGTIEPDGLFTVDNGTQRRAVAVEIHNTTNLKRVIEQLRLHAYALSVGSVSEALKSDRANLVLSVTFERSASEHIRKEISHAPGFDKFAPLFLFNDLSTLWKEGFGTGWVYADGSPADFFV